MMDWLCDVPRELSARLRFLSASGRGPVSLGAGDVETGTVVTAITPYQPPVQNAMMMAAARVQPGLVTVSAPAPIQVIEQAPVQVSITPLLSDFLKV